MSSGARLVLFRHGPTNANEAGRFQGWSDADLGPRGERAVEATVRHLVVVLGVGGIDAIVSSDLPRARQTAALLGSAAITAEPRLRELNFGVFEGRTREELRETAGPIYQAWLDDPERRPPPGGESLTELRDRVMDWWNELRPDILNSAVPRGRRPSATVVVTHGGPIGLLLGHLLGPLDPEREAVPAPGGFIVLRPKTPSVSRAEATWYVEARHKCRVPVSPDSRGENV